MLTWSNDGTVRLSGVSMPEQIQTFKHQGTVCGAQFSQDESRVLTWSADGRARVWDVTKPGPIQMFKHDSSVNGVQLRQDKSRC